MSDTPKAERKSGKYGLMRERDPTQILMVSGLTSAAADP